MKFSLFRLPWFFFTLFAALLAVALVRHYSDVPFWDMWDGYLDFYNRVLNGDLSAWWYQHNEHRIILSRLLFWLDIAWFGGKSAFLITVNFLLAVAGALLMGEIFREVFRGQPYSNNHWLLYTLCLALPLSWMQEENFAWAFQSQFFLAQLLPLMAFYSFYLCEKNQSWGWFMVSLALGVASAGTMANGVAVLPLLALVSLLASEARFRKSFFYGLAAAVVLTLYFSSYQSPPGHGSLASTIAEHPIELLKYTALYIGSPVHFLLGQVSAESWDTPVLYVSMFSGFFLMLGSLVILIIILRSPHVYVLEITLLGFIAYIGATAFGSGGGRLIFGIEQALAGRYLTASISLWLCFLILFLRLYKPSFVKKPLRKIATVGLSTAILLSLLPQVSSVASDNRDIEFERNAALLAMSLGIRDAAQTRHVYPWVDGVMNIAQDSKDSEISVFSRDERFYQLEQKLNLELDDYGSINAEGLSRCTGSVDEVMPIVDSTQYIKLRGWLHEVNTNQNTPLIVTLDNGDRIGYLITGKERPDVADAIAEEARYSGYYGYILQGKTLGNKRIYVHAENIVCWLDVEIVEYPFKASSDSWDLVSLTVNDIVNDLGWSSRGFEKTQRDGFSVFDSHVGSDEDVGELTLLMEDGDSLMFKTGPSNQNQFIKVGNEDAKIYPIPVSIDWSLLTFISREGNEEPVEVTLTDRGVGWGQWSALGIVSQSK